MNFCSFFIWRTTDDILIVTHESFEGFFSAYQKILFIDDENLWASFSIVDWGLAGLSCAPEGLLLDAMEFITKGKHVPEGFVASQARVELCVRELFPFTKIETAYVRLEDRMILHRYMCSRWDLRNVT